MTLNELWFQKILRYTYADRYEKEIVRLEWAEVELVEIEHGSRLAVLFSDSTLVRLRQARGE